MSTTREKVLETLLARPRCTINDLAESVGIDPISVRHHISRLQIDGLVGSEEENNHGVGRPHRVYFLTEAGLEKFPSRYIRLTIRLLEQLKETMPPAMVNQLFSQMAAGLISDYTSSAALQDLGVEERLQLLKDVLQREGFVIDWQQTEDGYQINETSCPYYHIGQDHPEVCSVDQMFISSLLSVPVQKTRCILNGDSYCTYIIPTPVFKTPKGSKS